jgi:uncharacterized damage-inducible protein DinB
MQPFFEVYSGTLQSLHAEFERLIDGLSQTALDWQPGQDMNSLAVLLAHVAGSERYWIGDVAGQEPSHRVREEEFRTQMQDAAALRRRLADALAHSQQILQRLTMQDLEQERESSLHGRTYTVAYALMHALEHMGTHLGHAQLVRQLWDQREKP